MKAGNIEYKQASDLPDELPILTDESVFILPGTYVPIIIELSDDLELIENAFTGNKLLGILQAKDYNIGCIARITSVAETGDGKTAIALEGICRFYLGEISNNYSNYPLFTIEPIITDFEKSIENLNLKPYLDSYLHNNNLHININNESYNKELQQFANVPFDILLNSLCINANFNLKERQLLLEADTTKERAQLFLALSERALMNKQNNKSTILN